jgi:hypothetical protein
MKLEEALLVVRESGYKVIGIFDVQQEIIKSLDSLSKLYDAYFNCRLFETTSKRSLLKKIERENNNVVHNIELLNEIHRGHILKFFKDETEKSNTNVKLMAVKIVNITIKYERIQGKFDFLDLSWNTLYRNVLDQDYFTVDYNHHSSLKLLSILDEIEKYVVVNNIKTKTWNRKIDNVLKS